MSVQGDQQWFEGRDGESFEAAAKEAVRRAEEELPEPWPTLYDVKLQVGATGVLSDYRVFVSPGG